MGWYDAFSSNVNTAAILKNTTSDKGSAGKHFGDAFVEFGKSMRDVENERKKDEVADSNIEASNARTTLYETQNIQAEKDNTYNNTTRKNTVETKKFDDAFLTDIYSSPDVDYKKSLIEFEKPDEDFGTGVSSSAFALANKNIEHTEDRANTNAAQLKAIKDAQVKSTYLNNLHNKDAKINLLNVKNSNTKDLTKIQVAQQKDAVRLSKMLSDKTYNKDGQAIYDKDQLSFFSDYINDNYNPADFTSMKNDAKAAYELVKSDARAKEASTLMDDKKEYENLTPEQKIQAGEYYIKTGEFPSVKVTDKKGLFSGNSYTLDIKTPEEVTQVTPKKETPKKSSMFSDFVNSNTK